MNVYLLENLKDSMSPCIIVLAENCNDAKSDVFDRCILKDEAGNPAVSYDFSNLNPQDYNVREFADGQDGEIVEKQKASNGPNIIGPETVIIKYCGKKYFITTLPQSIPPPISA